MLLAGATDTSPRVSWPTDGSINGTTFTGVDVVHFTDWGPSTGSTFYPAFLVPYIDFYAQAVSGDSGSPAFVVLSESELALAGCITSDQGDGDFPDEDLLNAMIAQVDAVAGVSTGYTVTVAPNPVA